MLLPEGKNEGMNEKRSGMKFVFVDYGIWAIDMAQIKSCCLKINFTHKQKNPLFLSYSEYQGFSMANVDEIQT